MYSSGISQNKFYTSQILPVQAEDKRVSSPITNAQNTYSLPSFKAAQAPVELRTKLNTPEEKKKYSQIVEVLNRKERKNLEMLLKNGILLSTKSNDKSSTLDNLHKIITNPRAEGLDAKIILQDTIKTIADPFIITQNFGDIPEEYKLQAVALENGGELPDNLIKRKLLEFSTNVENSGTCVSASIEFNLAKQTPAEFARFAEQLSSPKLSVDKTIQSKNLANNTMDTVWLLNAFEIPYKMDNFEEAHLTLAPDKNALLRAQIQTKHRDPHERSVVDVLMQSTFMNVGSQQAYDSLTDIREGKFNDDNRGLIEFEKTFTESIVENKNKISVTYQKVDENGKLVGYETDFDTIKRHITESLEMGENVIIGYTQTDESGTIINGHEITITGTKQDRNGKMIFVCNDTDDNIPYAIEYPEEYIIPKIHHAGLPQEIAEKDVKYVDNWVEGVNAYNEAKKVA